MRWASRTAFKRCEMIKEVRFEGTTYNELPYKFEAGTPDIGGIIAFGAAVDYLAAIGFDELERHERTLTERLLEILRSEGEAIRVGHHCCQPLMRRLKIPGTARASVYAYNTLEEMDAFAKALRKAKDFFRVTSAR